MNVQGMKMHKLQNMDTLLHDNASDNASTISTNVEKRCAITFMREKLKDDKILLFFFP